MAAVQVFNRSGFPTGATESMRDQQAIISYVGMVQPLPCGAVFGTPVWTTGQDQRSATPVLHQDATGPNKRLAGVMITRVQNPNYRLTSEVPSTVAISGLITIAENTGKHTIQEGDIVLCLPPDMFPQQGRPHLVMADKRGITVPLRIFERDIDQGTVPWSKGALQEAMVNMNAAADLNAGANAAVKILLEFHAAANAAAVWGKIQEKDRAANGYARRELINIWTRAAAQISNYRLGIAQQNAKPGKQFSVLMTINEYHA